MSAPLILYEVTDAVATITLNRPEVVNAFNREMSDALQRVLDDAANDDAVRAVLLTGAGRAFSSGQDLAAVSLDDPSNLPDLGDYVRASWNPIIQRLRRLEKPVVCAVNGVAAGAGANVALACDIVVASTAASFVQAFSKIGLIPDSGGTFFLPRLVGTARATAMMMLAPKISATQARDWGMIWEVYEPDELLTQARAIATTLATLPTRGLWLTKRALNESTHRDVFAQLDVEEALQREAGKTHDFLEGVKAFLEKRPPAFTGR